MIHGSHNYCGAGAAIGPGKPLAKLMRTAARGTEQGGFQAGIKGFEAGFKQARAGAAGGTCP